MVETIKHVYRSIKSFKINPLRLALNELRKKKHFEAKDYITKNDFSHKNFKSFLDLSVVQFPDDFGKTLNWHSLKWQNHYFDQLGTSWVSRNIGTQACGFLGFTIPESTNEIEENKNREILCQRSKNHIDPNYKCIDWQMDIKSGYRWNPTQSSAEQSNFLKMPYGVDVKIPWELARFGHLPLFLISAQLENSDSTVILKEFKNQVCDFISNNPYRKGINWSNAMEVAIRAVNLLVSLDLALKIDRDEILDENFKAIFFDSIFEHATFILENSEYKFGQTNNHYYANISGLLIIGYYLRETESGKTLLNIAANEIYSETSKQFLNDGGNFESSTHYHRLSTEMLIWNIIFLRKAFEESLLEDKKLTKWNTGFPLKLDHQNSIAELLKIADKAIHFSEAITKPNGKICACGDQDSGRFLKLSFSGEWKYFRQLKESDQQIKQGLYNWNDEELLWIENDLDQKSLLALFSKDDKLKQEYPIEYAISPEFKKYLEEELPIAKPKSVKYKDLLYWHTSTVFFPKSIPNLKKELEWKFFPEFGIYLAKHKDFQLSVFGTNNHLLKYWSHGKNDKLSFELYVCGEDLIVDPGSFIYTPDEVLRNKFRSTSSHSTISVNKQEQNRWPVGKKSVFNLYNESKCKFLSQIDNSISLLCEYHGIKHIRTFKVHNDHLEIIDECNREFEPHFNYHKIYSDHYGRWKISQKES